MVSIQNEAQQKFIYKLCMNVHEYRPIWLGLVDLVNEDTWQWISS